MNNKLKNKLAENNFSIVYELIPDELRENVTGIAFSHIKKLNTGISCFIISYYR